MPELPYALFIINDFKCDFQRQLERTRRVAQMQIYNGIILVYLMT